MKSKYIISVKSTGLCYNIIRVILLADKAREYNRQLIFISNPDHIPILKKFNNDCVYLPFTSDHTDRFNNFKRTKCSHLVYDLTYKSFLKSAYIDSITDNNIKMDDMKYINGCVYDITDSDHDILLIDYSQDIKYTVKALYNIPHNNFNIKNNPSNKYNSSILSTNIRADDPDNSRIYELWDEIIPALKQEYNMPILLISGNNDIKKYLGDKHDCMYEIKETEIRHSFRRNSNKIKGITNHVYDDLLICRSTHFIPLIELKDDFKFILSTYGDIKFMKGMLDEKGSGIEHFDVLAHYLSIPIPVL